MSKYLEITNLTYEYPDGYKALNEISFNLEEGDSLGILGPNGAGKTTLILHLNGILGEMDGSIKLNNLEFVEDNLAEIRKTVGVVFQDPDDQLFMPTVLEDVMFGPKNFGFSEEASRENAEEALKMVGMNDYQEKAPHHLSFGQKRKVAIASVLASKPQLLVLDEPSSNLDPSSRRELIDILLSLEISIVLVTHDLPMALEICPKSIVVNSGLITENGKTKDLLTNNKVMKENRLELPYGFALHHLDEE
ncbi:energy-coupling factor ABC transporter ATP-binding protein [Acidimicrobiia bacterium]|jgi:cobalt/nickel transport system ATP-binding protein|nr:energy-coupling factor ABC transporter ATP-binding protein [Acidimicrobiia bacterium]MDA7721335.1 energy-coupling factor ABC transporter ATP-binding protein [Acidimicrobiaceae bacterium]MDA8653404.1 energy-coupling factor ABC transporter ATP-binding protein [Candidatus Actinomarina sp.]MDC3275382.1 energy-coupling factor ABC transporter ATP-binding protein [bacterium]MDA7736221.1 energy-coupling factor ABC transporter ATP-binding protein [Acidimicrobiaceae bacterium]|tara:strand:+ start:11679 stop:12425 length:747 start_codon:yes stop_codon:yes gene_type:complete